MMWTLREVIMVKVVLIIIEFLRYVNVCHIAECKHSVNFYKRCIC